MPRRKKGDAFDRDTGFRVSSKVCDECLYSKNKIVEESTKQAVLNECRKKNRYFICHKFTLTHKAAVCRGFFNKEPNQACQMAERLGLVVYVDPPDVSIASEALRTKSKRKRTKKAPGSKLEGGGSQ